MTQSSTNNRYLYPYSQGVKLDIRKKGVSIYQKYPARLYGSLSAAYEVARTDRDRILRDHGIPSANYSSRHLCKREGAQSTYQGLPLPPGLSVQYVRGKPMYFVVRNPVTGSKTRFPLAGVDVKEVHQQAMALLSQIRE